METRTIAAGTEIITDSRLEKGWIFQALKASTWDGAPYVLPGRDLIPDQAVRVELTGRGVRFDVPKLAGQPVVRVRVTFVTDGAEGEEVVVGGWVRA